MMGKRKTETTLHEINVQVQKHEPPQLYLREQMASAKGNGVEIEVCKNVNGDCLIFGVSGANGEAQYVVRTYDLVAAIADLHLQNQPSANAT